MAGTDRLTLTRRLLNALISGLAARRTDERVPIRWRCAADVGRRPSTTVGGSGLPACIDACVVVAMLARQRAERNLLEYGKAKLALGPTRDMVIIDAVLERMISVADSRADFAGRYAARPD